MGRTKPQGDDDAALPFDTTLSDYNLELMQAAGTLVSGATTYRGFASYLASSRRRPGPARSRAGHLAPRPRTRASRGLLQPYRGGDRPWPKKGEGGALVALGSVTTWNDLLAAGLVDEPHMTVGAGVLVHGVPAFSVRPPGPMRLTEARQLGDCNVARLLYSLG